MLRSPVFHAIAGIALLLALLAFIFRGTPAAQPSVSASSPVVTPAK